MEKQEARDWAALPRDMVLEIMGRLQQADVLRGAGLACAPWWRAAVEEPTLWRTIDVHFNDEDGVSGEGRLAMGRAAVDRSAGRCESFRGLADLDLLIYLAARAPSLRSLHVMSAWCLPHAFFDRVITKLPMLERLLLSGGHLLKSTLVRILEHCPRLEVLDAGDCSTDKSVGLVMLLKYSKKMKVLVMPWAKCQYCFCSWCLSRDPYKGYSHLIKL